MQFISGFNHDAQTDKPKPGSYEWWYFDAMSANGVSIVIIFYEGNPFSRRYITSLQKESGKKADQFPAISISVYQNGKPLFYSFEEVDSHDAGFSKRQPSGRVGKNSFEGSRSEDEIEYRVQLDQQVANGDKIEAILSFKKKEPFFEVENLSGQEIEANHSWNLVLPVCSVEGDLKISGFRNREITFRGEGYHDHNTGTEPMKDSFTEWYWGRYHMGNYTFIYYLMLEHQTWQKKAWLIESNQGFIHWDDEIEMSDYSWSLFGLKSARKIEFRGAGIEALLQLDRRIDNGPFYQRFEGRLLLKTGNELSEARGLSEYIYPQRIYKRRFWPLVNMRIKYPDRNHWVQKSPRLYRWTW